MKQEHINCLCFFLRLRHSMRGGVKQAKTSRRDTHPAGVCPPTHSRERLSSVNGRFQPSTTGDGVGETRAVSREEDDSERPDSRSYTRTRRTRLGREEENSIYTTTALRDPSGLKVQALNQFSILHATGYLLEDVIFQ